MVGSCVCSFHMYQDIWTPTVREHLSCQVEDSNGADPFTGAIKKRADIIGVRFLQLFHCLYREVVQSPV